MKNNKTSISNILRYLLLIPMAMLLMQCAGDNKTIEDGKVYENVDQLPEYPEGNAALMKFIQNNLKYPPQAAQAGEEGRVVVQFTVLKTGEVADVSVVESVSAACDREAMRVVRIMPRWVPGKHNGKEVAVYFNLPIKFRLS